MSSLPLKSLPDDPAALKALLATQAHLLERREAELAQERAARHKDVATIEHQSVRIDSLKETINKLLAQRFGRSSEKLPELDAAQIHLFDEAETILEADAGEPDDDDGIEVAGHKRRPRRAPIPADLPRVDVLHDLPAEQQFCPHDGSALKRIGEDVSEQLDIIPAKIQVLRHVRAKYACPCCDRHIALAERAPQILPKSLASEGLAAYVVTCKYIDGMPLNRICKAISRIGVDISRQTMAGWVIAVAQPVDRIVQRMSVLLNACATQQMDETRVQVLREPGKTAQSQSYMWVRTGGQENGTPIRLFHYAPTRSGDVPIELLDGFTGYLQTDGYAGYEAVHAKNGLTPVFCMAHCRRYYADALKAMGINLKNLPAAPPVKAKRLLKAMRFIQKLYAIERRIRDLPPDERLRIRQAEAVPILDDFKAWVIATQPKITPGSALGEALAYTAKHWDGLARYAEDGRLEIDTNRTENAIRPFVVGRRAWTFCASQAGARASATLYSLIESAKANGHEPYAYLRHIFTQVAGLKRHASIDHLLPWNVSIP